MFYKFGGKQLYYFNTFDGATDDFDLKAPELAAAEAVEDDEDCESCVI